MTSHGAAAFSGGVAALEVAGLSKSFGGQHALSNVGFSVGTGEIHGLLGQNGSGKSTFVKILAGFHRPDPGSVVHLAGYRVELPLASVDLTRRGLSFVHQNLGLIPSLTVLENLRIASLTSGARWRIDWAHERQEARAAFERFALDIDPRARVDSLSQVDRALVAIVRAFEAVRLTQAAHQSSGLLLLDEPTPFLTQHGVEQLFGLMRQIVAGRASVIFISHDIDEIREITDRVTVLRDGEVVGTVATPEMSREAIIELIVGRKLARFDSGAAQVFSPEAFVTVHGLTGPRVRELDLELRQGEIVGLTGLVGAGHEHVLYHLFGVTPGAAGRLMIGGKSLDIASLTPRRALQFGINLLPGDRQGASGIGALDVADNLFLPDVSRFFTTGWLRRADMRRSTAQIGAEYGVVPAIPDLPLAALSGGNAQKVLLAKWLKLKPRLLLLEEPTQGVDIGARQQLLSAIKRTAQTGAAVLCASSDHEQLADLCDRVLVFVGGSITASLTGSALTKQHISECCFGREPTAA